MGNDNVVIPKGLLQHFGMDRIISVFTPFHFEDRVALSGVSLSEDVSIGRYTYMNNGYIRGRVDIGRFCAIGRNVGIAAADHPYQALTTHPIVFSSAKRIQLFNRAAKRARTTIGNDVWIGDNVIINPGVVIGTGAVIGANAVVSKDVEAYSIVGGVPARHIKYRFEPEIREQLLASEWWMMPDAEIKSLNMNDIPSCILMAKDKISAGRVQPLKYECITELDVAMFNKGGK